MLLPFERHTYYAGLSRGASRRTTSRFQQFRGPLLELSRGNGLRRKKVEPLKDVQPSHVYQAAHVGPMVAELVRPDVSGENWGGHNMVRLRISALARAVQTRLPYLHHCTPLYCLKNRAQCRFFCPWPYQPQQCYCDARTRSAWPCRDVCQKTISS